MEKLDEEFLSNKTHVFTSVSKSSFNRRGVKLNTKISKVRTGNFIESKKYVLLTLSHLKMLK